MRLILAVLVAYLGSFGPALADGLALAPEPIVAVEEPSKERHLLVCNWTSPDPDNTAFESLDITPLCDSDSELAKGYSRRAIALRKEALAGKWWSQYILGIMLAEGVGAPKDAEKAFYWMNRAAIRARRKSGSGGHPETTLGRWYLTGKLAPYVKVNDELALRWSKLGAVEGHPNAYLNLALMHGIGLGVEKDLGKATMLIGGAMKVFIHRRHAYLLDYKDNWARFGRGEVPMELQKLKRWVLETLSNGYNPPPMKGRISKVDWERFSSK